MQTLLYDGTFEGFLCAVFDVYYYKFREVEICSEHQFQGNIFLQPHHVYNQSTHKERVYKGLNKKLSHEAMEQIYRTFLSELHGIENILLDYIQYVFASDAFIEKDFSRSSVLTITQTAKKVWREQHRMEAFVRFQKTSDGLYYALIEPDYNVLPLIIKHFKQRYADQRWLIYDGKRKYGMYYDLDKVQEVQISFTASTSNGKDARSIYDEKEQIFQQLWQQYFNSINIAARKNTKLHIQHMPKRYWRHLPEKNPY